MKTFFNIFLIWPIKLALLIMAIGLIFVVGLMFFSKLSAMGKDIKTIKAKLF
jgi:hypothetical protein